MVGTLSIIAAPPTALSSLKVLTKKALVTTVMDSSRLPARIFQVQKLLAVKWPMTCLMPWGMRMKADSQRHLALSKRARAHQ